MEALVPQLKSCSYCGVELSAQHNFCTSCGFPEKGTEDEKSRFHSVRVLKNRRTDDANKRIKSGRTSLFVISALSFLFGLLFFFTRDDLATLVASAILALIYLGLAFWSQQRPLIALILGLLVFLTTLVINALVDPNSLYQGIIIKIFVFAYLVKGIASALEVRKLQTVN